MYIIPEELYEFTATDCDRVAYIQYYLDIRGVGSSIVPIGSRHHVYVEFPSSFYDSNYKRKIVIAHHDRVPKSPGANDNSAAVFQIMDWAVRMYRKPDKYNVRIFFTDGEEQGFAGGVKEQGSFGVAKLLKKLGCANDDVYVFDACGRGDIPIIAKTVLDVNVPRSFRERFNDLYERAKSLVNRAAFHKWLSLPVAYSDNAGFLACGIPAVAITMLPADEVDDYRKKLILHKELENQVINPQTRGACHHMKTDDDSWRLLIPKTWRMFHTRQDTVGNLDKKSFDAMAAILDALSADNTAFSYDTMIPHGCRHPQ